MTGRDKGRLQLTLFCPYPTTLVHQGASVKAGGNTLAVFRGDRDAQHALHGHRV